MRFDHRHLLGIEPLRPDEITTLLDLADQYAALNRRRDKHAQALAGDILLIDIRRPDEWAGTGSAASGHRLDRRDPGR